MSYQVLLLENIHSNVKESFEKYGFSVKSISTSLSEEELSKCFQGHEVSILGIRSKTQINRRILESCPSLLVIGCFCIGTDTIDLEAAKEYGICVFNAPFSSGRSVAELCIGEIICLSRRLPDKIIEMHNGTWNKSATLCHEIRGKTLGIVGYGNIGCQISVLAENLGMNVLYYDILSKVSLGNAKSCPDLKTLLQLSDFVTLHVPDTPLTHNLIDSEHFSYMKPESILINASRGKVVDIDALREALILGHLSGCAIDVHPSEPASNTKSWTSPLQGLSNCILTPHIGGSTEEAQENIGIDVSSKIIKYLIEGTTLMSVNFPQVQLFRTNPSFRICHIHKNVPGVLKKLNGILDSINIIAQSLSTLDDIGVCILDCDQKLTLEQEKTIREMDETIKFIKLPFNE